MPKKILLAEDEAIIALCEAKLIEKHGYPVVTVRNGEQAIEAVEGDPEISLILMDIDLGDGMDGTKTAELILQKYDIPVVFLSGHTEPEVVEKTEKITSYGYVVKNSGDTVLIASIEMAFRLHETKCEAQRHRKESERACREIERRDARLRHLNRVLLSLRNVNQLITKENDRSGFLDNACRLLIETNGYHTAWIVMMENGKPAGPFFHAGFGKKFAPMAERLRSGYIPRCARQAIERRNIVVTEEPETECTGCPLRYEHRRDERDTTAKATMTACLEHDGTRFGWLTVMSPRTYSRDPEEHRLFSEIAGDIAYALYNMENEFRYRELFNRIHDAVAVYEAFDNGTDFIFKDFNPSAERIEKISREELVGKRVTEVFPGVIEFGLLDVFRQVWKTGTPQYHPVSMYKDTRILGWRENYVYRLHSGEVVAAYRDITDRVKTESTLQESEENLRTTLNSIGDAVIATDIEGRIKQMNPVAEKLTGWTAAEATGKPLNSVFVIVNEETRDTAENPVDKMLRKGVIVGLANHTLLISKNGKEIPIADSGAPIRNKNGLIIGIVLVFRDQTEERRKERKIQESARKYRGLFNSIRDAILVADTDRNIIDCNPAFIDLFGYSLDEIKGKKTVTVYESEEEFEQMGDALKEHRGSYSDFLFTVHYKKKDGTVFPGETNVFYLHDDDGIITDFIGLIRDITERKKAEERKELLMKEIHHRVKNNLAMVASLINLKESASGGTVDLSDLARRINAMSIVHEQLYHGEEFTRIDFKNYTQKLLDMVFSSFTTTRVKVINSIENIFFTQNIIVPLGLIINEIATNAIKHGFSHEEKEVRFTVDIKKDISKNNYILTLSNTGKPFPEDIDFDQAETLGIQLISALVDQIRGTIELKREPHPVFTIRFPSYSSP